MKKLNIVMLTVIALSMGAAQAGGGKSFGAALGGSFLGSTLGNAISRPSHTVVVSESSNSRHTNKAVRQLSSDIDLIFENMEKMRKGIREMAEEITDLKAEVKKLRRSNDNDERPSKKRKAEKEEAAPKKSSSWLFSSDTSTDEDEE